MNAGRDETAPLLLALTNPPTPVILLSSRHPTPAHRSDSCRLSLFNQRNVRPYPRAQGVIMEKIKLSGVWIDSDGEPLLKSSKPIKGLFVYPAAEVDAEIERLRKYRERCRKVIGRIALENKDLYSALRLQNDAVDDMKLRVESLVTKADEEILSLKADLAKHRSVVEAAIWKKDTSEAYAYLCYVWPPRNPDAAIEILKTSFKARDDLDEALRELDGCAGGKGE